MKIKYMYNFYLVILAALLLSGCNNSDDAALEKAMASDTTANKAEISSALMNEIIESIPSPMEMSSMIHEIEPKFNGEFLNDPTNLDKYATTYQKAINIGIYGTDLGFINMYNDKKDAVAYLDVMVRLAEDLKIGQFFNYEAIKRLATNRNNLDSLLYITTNDYDKINLYLQEQNKGDISLMMLTGGWIEALYIASTVAEKDHNEKLYERVGEQKIILDQLKILLDFYKNDAKLNALNKKLDGLKTIYDSVNIVTEYHKPTIEVVNGFKMVTDNNKTVIKITKQEVDEIFTIVSAIRKELIQ